MSIVRVAGYSQGSDLTGEPVNWLIFDTETKERRIEWNPLYVPPPPPTDLDLARWAVEEAEHELREARSWLEEVTSKSHTADDPATPEGKPKQDGNRSE